jgi:hypothetical protein
MGPQKTKPKEKRRKSKIKENTFLRKRHHADVRGWTRTYDVL